MNRNAYALDLLRPDLTTEEQVQHMFAKRELTQEDFDVIIDACKKISAAATIMKDVLD